MPIYSFDQETNAAIQKALSIFLYHLYYKGTVESILGLKDDECPLPKLRALISSNDWVVVIQKKNYELAYVLRVVKKKCVPNTQIRWAWNVLQTNFPLEFGTL